MENLQDAKKWINERLTYIAKECDLQDTDNKRAFNSLNIALECIKKVESQEKITIKNTKTGYSK